MGPKRINRFLCELHQLGLSYYQASVDDDGLVAGLSLKT